jgi:hypothetical protein
MEKPYLGGFHETAVSVQTRFENMQGFKALRENSTYKLSPEGTAESSPGRSPG